MTIQATGYRFQQPSDAQLGATKRCRVVEIVRKPSFVLAITFADGEEGRAYVHVFQPGRADIPAVGDRGTITFVAGERTDTAFWAYAGDPGQWAGD